GRVDHRAPAPAPLARRRPCRLRGLERRSRGDAPLHRAAGWRAERRAAAPHRRRARPARLGAVGTRGARARAAARLHRPGAGALHGALHARGGDRLAPGALALGARPGERGGPRVAGVRIRRARPCGGRRLHLHRQRALARGHAPHRHDTRPGRRLRAPGHPGGPSAEAARPLPAAATRARL
ncbi:MAG: Acetyltransferase, GNAT family, partial [uncultured Solirubrobacteraceae bacterium]